MESLSGLLDANQSGSSNGPLLAKLQLTQVPRTSVAGIITMSIAAQAIQVHMSQA